MALTDNDKEAMFDLTLRLVEVISDFINTGVPTTRAIVKQVAPANDNSVECDEDRVGKRPSDPMTLKEVQWELRLKSRQIDRLRQTWNFPAPYNDRGLQMFSRREVEQWVRAQPNQRNLAAVLRLRGHWLVRVASPSA